MNKLLQIVGSCLCLLLFLSFWTSNANYLPGHFWVDQTPHSDIITPIHSKDAIDLGRALFWDPILSGNKDVACATCHHPDFGYSDGRDLSIGVGGKGLGTERIDVVDDDIQTVKRNAPSIINVAFNGIKDDGVFSSTKAPMFWDLRKESLEIQAMQPVKAFDEMRGHAYAEADAWDSIVYRLKEIPTYQVAFDKVFEEGNQSITIENMSRAIAAFERTIVSNNSPYDKYMQGQHYMLSEEQIIGMKRFEEVGCAKCHNGPMFSDFELHILGVPDNEKLGFSDAGSVDSIYAFRTPTMRNLSFTAPYYHNGTSKTIEDAVEFYLILQEYIHDNNIYKSGEGVNPHIPSLSPLLFDMDMKEEDIYTISAFLRSLDDDSFDKTIPESVPSGLPVGGNIYE